MKSSGETDRLGHYLLHELLGEGGMARVFRARDTRLERDVAIKVLRPTVASSPKAAERFRREARLAASLRHPNVVTVHDCSADDEEQLYLVTELVEGGSLRRLLEGRGPLLGEEAALLLLPAARALGAAHALGIVHRDVKPDNILVDRSGEAVIIKLADFGVAFARDEPRITTDGAQSGSVVYMAPEQLRDGTSSAATDIWAMGATLAELVGGQPLFGQGTVGQVVARIMALDERSDPLQGLPHREVLSPELRALLRRCLTLRPEQRFSRGAELARALEQALAAAGITRPDDELQRWDREGGYQGALAVRLAGELVEAARDAPVTERAELLDRALALVPDHGGALRLLEGPCPAPGPPGRPGSSGEPPHRPRRARARLLWIWIVGALLLLGALGALAVVGLPGLAPPAARAPATPDSTAPAALTRAAPDSAAPLADAGPVGPPDRPSRRGGTADAASGRRSRPAHRAASPRRRAVAEPRQRHGTVQLTTRPWAEVLVQGRSLGYTPTLRRFELEAGEHRITLKNPLCRPRTLRLRLQPGETVMRHVELEVLPARLRLRAPAGWQVRVDGKAVGPTPLSGPLNLAHGTHRIVAIDPAGREHRRTVRLTAGKTVTLELE
jgi:serine/threonine-protein kinase